MKALQQKDGSQPWLSAPRQIDQSIASARERSKSAGGLAVQLFPTLYGVLLATHTLRLSAQGSDPLSGIWLLSALVLGQALVEAPLLLLLLRSRAQELGIEAASWKRTALLLPIPLLGLLSLQWGAALWLRPVPGGANLLPDFGLLTNDLAAFWLWLLAIAPLSLIGAWIPAATAFPSRCFRLSNFGPGMLRLFRLQALWQLLTFLLVGFLLALPNGVASLLGPQQGLHVAGLWLLVHALFSLPRRDAAVRQLL